LPWLRIEQNLIKQTEKRSKSLEEENFKIREKTDKVKELLKKTVYEGKRLKEEDLK